MTAQPALLHLGGNGHASVRLDRAREALERLGGPRLVDVPYPGFEGRPRVASLDSFLASLEGSIARVEPPVVGVVASGIGALIALGLRTRGGLAGLPIVFQGPVLWGLEERWFPTLMRPKFARQLLAWVIQRPWAQARFVRKHFRKPLDPSLRARFFQGYADCSAFADPFDWFTPAYLRHLEAEIRDRPESVEGITVWVGGEDAVVGQAEVDATERAIGVRWPVVEHPGWGHYPAIDEPEEWAQALRHALVDA